MTTRVWLLMSGPAGLAAWLLSTTTPTARLEPHPLPPPAADGVEWFWALNGPVSSDAGSDPSARACTPWAVDSSPASAAASKASSGMLPHIK
jgi:hypothetical protein